MQSFFFSAFLTKKSTSENHLVLDGPLSLTQGIHWLSFPVQKAVNTGSVFRIHGAAIPCIMFFWSWEKTVHAELKKGPHQ
jgi:hypothetical protein